MYNYDNDNIIYSNKGKKKLCYWTTLSSPKKGYAEQSIKQLQNVDKGKLNKYILKVSVERAKHNTTIACWLGKVEQVYIKSKCGQSQA